MPAAMTALARLLAALVAAAAIVLAVQWIVGRVAARLSLADHPALAEMAIDLLIFGSLAAVAAIGLRVAHETPAIGSARLAGVGVAMGVGGLATALVMASLAGVVARGETAWSGGLLVSLGSALTLGQTAVEELYFRGWLQPALRRGWGRWPGLLAASAAFAALHLVGGGTTASSLASILLAGIWFGVLADRSGGLALPIGAHFGWNWAEELLFGAAPNPGTGSFGTAFDIDLVGNVAWSGGDQGLNASVAAVFVLVALLVLTLAWPTSGARAAMAPARV